MGLQSAFQFIPKVSDGAESSSSKLNSVKPFYRLCAQTGKDLPQTVANVEAHDANYLK